MKYYIEIKNELINNEINRKVKNYSNKLTNELGNFICFQKVTHCVANCHGHIIEHY